MPDDSRQPLHASGLGLMLYSRHLLGRLPDGYDVEAALTDDGWLAEAVAHEHTIAFLGVGSPQLYYRIDVVLGPARDEGVLGRVAFGLRLVGGLSVRDGYATYDWVRDDPHELVFDVPDGDYRVEATWCRPPPQSGVDMHIALSMAPTSMLPEGDGWPYLEYRVG